VGDASGPFSGYRSAWSLADLETPDGFLNLLRVGYLGSLAGVMM